MSGEQLEKLIEKDEAIQCLQVLTCRYITINIDIDIFRLCIHDMYIYI